MSSCVGEARLPAECPRVVGQEPVLVRQREPGLVGESGERQRPRRDRLGEQRVAHRHPEEQRQIVGRGRHAWSVEPGRRRGARVQRTELARGHVHCGGCGGGTAEFSGQGVGGVVAGVEQQPGEQLADGVAPARPHPHPAAVDVRVVRGALDDGVRVEPVERDECGEHLQRRCRTVPGVGCVGGQHRPGVQVGHHPGRGADRGWGDQPGRQDVTTCREPWPADGFIRPGQRVGWAARGELLHGGWLGRCCGARTHLA